MQPGYPGSGQDPYNQPPSDPFGGPGYGQYPPQQPDPYAQPQQPDPYAQPQQPDPYAQPPQQPPYSAPPASGAPYQDPYNPAGYPQQPQQPVSGQPYDPYNSSVGQQYYQQPQQPAGYPPPAGYQAPVVYPGAAGYTVPGVPQGGKSNTLGLLSMIFGIASIPLGLCCGLFGTPFSIAALIMGFIGLNKVKAGQADNKGMALAGVICGAAGLLVAIIMVIIGVAVRNDNVFGTY